MMSRAITLSIVGSGLLFVPRAHAQSTEDVSPASNEETRADSGDAHASGVTRPAPPTAPRPEEMVPSAPTNPWLVRPPLVVRAATAAQWSLTIYGFAEADMMRDSTRSFNDGLNNNVVAHIQTQAGDNARAQCTSATAGSEFRLAPQKFSGIRSSGLLEFDLFGNQPNINAGGGSPAQPSGPGATTEASYFNNAGLRVRHAYVKLKVTSLMYWSARPTTCSAGRTISLERRAGFWVCRMPCSIEPCSSGWAIPSRPMQSISISAAAALRPAQRDSALPEAKAAFASASITGRA